MMYFEDKYFTKFEFTQDQIDANLNNALRDFRIAKKDTILEVKFNYTYTALLKAGITLLSFHKRKVKSMPGHHIKVIEKLSDILKDKDIEVLANVMRSKRNKDLYDGGIEVTRKECLEYLKFVEDILNNVRAVLHHN